MVGSYVSILSIGGRVGIFLIIVLVIKRSIGIIIVFISRLGVRSSRSGLRLGVGVGVIGVGERSRVGDGVRMVVVGRVVLEVIDGD